MDENCLAYGIEISELDWEKTPASVKKLVEKMGQHIKQSEKRLADLGSIQLGRLRAATIVLGTFKTRIHQNIRASRSFKGNWKCSGKITGEII
jgi:hypothetical protein